MKRFIPLFLMIIMIFSCKNGSTKPDITKYPVHKNISVTCFWIGEKASEENGEIANIQSAWDDEWLLHYGGTDSPDNRDGYFPSDFIPKENPFYFALPYNDFTESGTRKNDAYNVVYWAEDKNWDEKESMCKNQWIKITKNGKIAYAQWEDAGPFGEDDYKYVFGDNLPSNQINQNAGLDVSPAVRDYLNLNDIDKVDWQFVDAKNILDGPWKKIVTTSQINWIGKN